MHKSEFLDDLKCRSRENFRKSSKQSMRGLLGQVHLKRAKFMELEDLLKMRKKSFPQPIFSPAQLVQSVSSCCSDIL